MNEDQLLASTHGRMMAALDEFFPTKKNPPMGSSHRGAESLHQQEAEDALGLNQAAGGVCTPTARAV